MTAPNSSFSARIANRLIIILVLGLVGLFAVWQIRKQIIQPPTTEISSQTIIEQVKKVAKLVTVEGHLSEIYTHKETEPFFGQKFSFNEKKALVKVKAKVLVGFDLEKMVIKADEMTKKVTITLNASPEILAIDHDLSYYDISEGYFNRFSETDYNKINEKAKNIIRESAQQSELFSTARKQGIKLFESMNEILSTSGWTVNIVEAYQLPMAR